MADLSKIKLNGTTYNIKDETTRTTLSALQNKNFVEIIDLGEMDCEDYNWDIFALMDDLDIDETGIYHFTEVQDGFDYFVTYENNNSTAVRESFWSTEDLSVQFRYGFVDGQTGEIDWNDWESYATYSVLNGMYSPTNHYHYEKVSTSSAIRTYLDSTTVFGNLSNNEVQKIQYVTCTNDNKIYFVYYFYNSSSTPALCRITQIYAALDNPSVIYIRTGTRANSTNTWGSWQEYSLGSSGGSLVTSLPDFDLSEDYDGEFKDFLVTLTNTGFYTVHETGDGFDYFIKVERLGDYIGYTYWSTEERKSQEYIYEGYFDQNDEVVIDDDPFSYLTFQTANSIFAQATHKHYEDVYPENIATIQAYINSMHDGEYHVVIGTKEYFCTQFSKYYNNNWHFYQEYYEVTDPDTIYRRSGIKIGNSTKTWDDWQVFNANLSSVAISGSYDDLEDTPGVATHSADGLMSANDKQVLDNLNPNVSVTYSNANSSTMAIMNAKQENLVDLLINEEPRISAQIRTSNLLNVNDETCELGYLSSSGVLTSSTNNNDTAGPYIEVTPGQDIYYTGIVGETVSSSINRRLHVFNANKQWIKQISFAGSLRVGDHWSTHGTVPANGAYVRVSWGVTDTNVMISVGAPNGYEPYYITPFEEITSASFQIAPNSDMTGAVTYTTTVPSAITDAYGFKYNPILGKIYLTTGHIASYNGETLPGYWWSDRDDYEEGHTPTTGAEVVYLLADEDIEEYSYTPLTVQMFYQKNYLVINNGKIINITYYAETLAAKHFTVYDGVRIGTTDIDETNVTSWNHAADEIDLKAPINSPIFTGSPQAPTPNVNVNNERIATTAFVQTKMGNIAPIETGKASKNYNSGEYIMLGGYLFKTTTSISSGTTFTSGTNIERTTVADELLYLLSLIP